jgi:hypothetical protein
MVSLEGPGQRRRLPIINLINFYSPAVFRPTQ